MKKYLLIIFCFLTLAVSTTALQAGNDDRVGQAGAMHLLINPWARSSGMHSINQASTRGLEAMRLNVGGLAFTNATEIAFASTRWLGGADITLSSFGFSQALGETGVLGVSLMSYSVGDQAITTEGSPDFGTGATYRPTMTNIALAFSKSFSESIHGGVLVRVVTESISDVSASGVAFDTGIQYVTGEYDQVKFGISLRNVGTPMSYKGDGLTQNVTNPSGELASLTQRVESFEMPSLLHIGAAYDFYIGEDHRLTVAGNFTSNSFSKDFLGAGVEYSFREVFMLRGGYKYADGAFDGVIVSNSALTGLAAGLTLELPFKKGGESTFALDYAFRSTDVFDNNHTLGLRINL